MDTSRVIRAKHWTITTCVLALLIGCNNPGATTSSDDPARSLATAPQPSNGGATAPRSTRSGFRRSRPARSCQAEGRAARLAATAGLVRWGHTGTSTTCQDAIAGSNEECDDGPGAELDACTSTCQTRDQPVVPAQESQGGERFLGVGRHPLSGADSGFALSYLQIEPLLGEPQVGVSTFDIWGKPAARVIASEGASPIYEANPVLAALPGGKYAVNGPDLRLECLPGWCAVTTRVSLSAPPTRWTPACRHTAASTTTTAPLL